MKRIIIANDNLFKAKQLLALADIDALTGLHNRRWMYSYYNNLCKHDYMHFMFIDIDNFKRVNDIYGHSMGDEVIKFVGRLIKSNINGHIIRIGGDEFVAMLNSTYTREEVIALAERMLRDMKENDFRKDIMSLISLSIGIILDQAVSTSLDDVLYKCDSAMYQAKSDGKNKYVVYTTMEKNVEISKNIEAEMGPALENGDFHIYLHPKVNMITSKLCGAEALSRWMHPIDGERLPEKYIPLFEKNGFIVKHDMYMYELICKTKAGWYSKGYEFAHLPVSVNMSRLHLYNNEFVPQLLSIAQKYGVSSSELEIEITESVFFKDSKELIHMVNKLKASGFSVSIDDFGSGYSALNMLKDIPVNIIKIDKEFLKLSANDFRGKKVLKNIIAMCKDLKLDIVSEGVEAKHQIDFLTSCGCEIAQGFFYSEPLNTEQFIEYAKENYVGSIDCIKFHFDNNFKSEDESYSGNFVGTHYYFDTGIFSTGRSLYFGGGAMSANYLNLPTEILYSSSYTISFWIRPEVLSSWVAILFFEYENGFCAYSPLAWEGNACYRIRDLRQAEAWYDTATTCLWVNEWSHIAFSYSAATEKTAVYINGLPVSTLENVPTLFGLNRLYVGGDVYQPGFQGHIAELNFYNEVLSPSDIADLHTYYVTQKDFIAFENWKPSVLK